LSFRGRGESDDDYDNDNDNEKTLRRGSSAAMNRQNFPTIALLMSLPLLGLIAFGGVGADGAPRLPLLTLLLVAELGAIINLIAAYLGLPALRERPLPRARLLRLGASLLLALGFALLLLAFWPGGPA
jgi:hypothetical protein